MNTITVGAVVAKNYESWLDGWLKSVESLERKPDEVVLVTDISIFDLPSWVLAYSPPTLEFDWVEWHRRLFDRCRTDYISWVNIDDRYLPHALNGSDQWNTDVVCLGNTFGDVVWLGEPDPEKILSVEHNCVPCGSAVALDAYRLSPGFKDFMPFSDWALWVGLALSGATFSRTGRVDYTYRWHADSYSPEEAEPTRLRIKEWCDGVMAK